MNQQKQEQDQKIMKDIEQKTEKIIINAIKTGKIVNPIDPNITTEKKTENMDLFQNIIQSGTNEFVSKTGREPTYSELRQMYG